MSEEVLLVARGIATAVAPESGLTSVQADLLGAIAEALTGVSVDYHALDPLAKDDLVRIVEDDALDFGPAEIDSDTPHERVSLISHRCV